MVDGAAGAGEAHCGLEATRETRRGPGTERQVDEILMALLGAGTTAEKSAALRIATGNLLVCARG